MIGRPYIFPAIDSTEYNQMVRNAKYVDRLCGGEKLPASVGVLSATTLLKLGDVKGLKERNKLCADWLSILGNN